MKDQHGELDRESFARAWATGTPEQQGEMLYDLVRGPLNMKDEVKAIKGQLKYLWGGIAVLSCIAAPLLYMMFQSLSTGA